MGAGSVKLVYACWGDLPHAPFRALLYMAIRSRDEDDPPRFWGGREELAFAIGSPVPALPAYEDRAVVRARKAGFAAVDRVIDKLTQVGAIVRVGRPRYGWNAEYELCLKAREWTTVSVVQMDHGERGAEDHGERGPQEKYRKTQDLPQEPTRSGGQGSERARASVVETVRPLHEIRAELDSDPLGRRAVAEAREAEGSGAPEALVLERALDLLEQRRLEWFDERQLRRRSA